MKLSFKMTVLTVYTSVLLVLGAGCRANRRHNLDASSGTLSSEGDPRNKQTKSFTLVLVSLNESESFTITARHSYRSSSPISFLKKSHFDEALKRGISIVDFYPSGSLMNPLSAVNSPEMCFQVGIYSLLLASGSNRSFLVSAFSDAPTKGLDASLPRGEVKYCETADAITITIPNEATGVQLETYLSQRGLTLTSSNQGLQLGSGGGGLKAIFDIEPKAIKSRIEAEGVLDEARLPRQDIVPQAITRQDVTALRPAFNKLKDNANFQQRLFGNHLDVQLYKELKIADLLTESNAIGKGAFATVYKVEIDGQLYAVRKEIRSTESAEVFEERVARERANFLAQNQFADEFADANFVRTELSCLTDNKEFVTISELREGGEFAKRIEEDGDFYDVDLAKRAPREAKTAELSRQLKRQLEIYQTGMPTKIGDREFTMSFFHGDIKPENVILNKGGSTASFIDFGFSRIVLKDLQGNYHQLKSHANAEPTIEPLRINGAGPDSVFKGTPYYMSPEILYLGKHSDKLLTGAEAYRVLVNADRFAFNTMAFEAFNKGLPRHGDASTAYGVMANIESKADLKLGKERQIIDYEDYKKNASPEYDPLRGDDDDLLEFVRLSKQLETAFNLPQRRDATLSKYLALSGH